MAQLLFPLIVLGLMWVLLIRPQQQRVRRQQELVASLAVGDEVITAGGILGRIVSLDEDEVHLEVAPRVVMRFVRVAVNARLGDDARVGDDARGDGAHALETGPADEGAE
ncbi:MAG: preprotein translocase subunit YajC [Actinomycetota bacterium]|nr:preprotein translocase subunit YajC [Actinomycetota bacterium]